MNKFKLFAIYFILVILAIGAVTIPLIISNKKEQAANEERMRARAEDYQKNNPDLYNALQQSVNENKNRISQNEKDQEAWIQLGVTYQNLGDYINAKNAFNGALKISDQSLVAWNNLADIYIDEKNYVKAEQTILKWIDSNKEPTAYIKLAEMYAQGNAGNIQDAVLILEKGVKDTDKQLIKDALQKLQLEGRL